MAAKPKIVKNARIEIDGVVLSDNSNNVTVNKSKNEIATTSFGSGGTRRAHGLSDDNFEVQFMQEYTNGSVDSTLRALHRDEEEFTVAIRASADPVSDDNPEWVGTCILLEYSPLDAAPGELSEISVTFPAQGHITEHTEES